MASVPRKILSKDQLIIAQNQVIEQLKATIQRLSSGSQIPGPDFASTSADHGLPGVELPTLSLEELSAYSDIQPLQFVGGQMVLQPAQVAVSVKTVAGRGGRGGGAKRGRSGHSPPKRRTHGTVAPVAEVVAEMEDSMINLLPVEEADGQVESDAAQEKTDGGSSQLVATNDQVSHILILGTPHTRKIPLKCTVPDCVHGEYKAWDRDLLLKHFKRYHAESHPNPAFNYLCPVDGCRYITYNEPSYALYTHIKNIHQDYLKRIEQNLADGVPVEERDLNEFHIDKLPSQIQRTPVPILGVLNMEKTGMRCPLPVCAAGTQVYKSSSMKRLYEHFAKVHSFTHPNPIFIYCCPAGDCDYSSDVGNFRVYYHLKLEHPEYVQQCSDNSVTKPQTAPPAERLPTESEETNQPKTTDAGGSGTLVSDHEEVSGLIGEGALEGEEALLCPSDEQSTAEDDSGEAPKTTIIMRGSRNMVLDPLSCPVEDCPKEGFQATSTATLRRHFKRLHRQTHPNPEFFFQCPVVGCEFVSSNKQAMNIWRHTKKVHPEIWLPGSQPVPKSSEDSAAVMEIGGEVAKETDGSLEPFERPLEDQLRVEAVQDVLNPHMLVKPAQVRCLHPGCMKPPFSGSDKVQLMRHYAHFHPSVDRLQEIMMVCPFKDCGYHCVWPAKPLYYHVESVHGKPVEEGSRPHADLLVSKSVKDRKAPVGGAAARTPIRIVGRPTAAGEFWCPVPGCGFSNNVLLNLRLHVMEKHAATYPNPAFIFVCPLQGCSFAKQSNYQALCTHMQREHGMKREKKAPKAGSEAARSSVKRKKEKEAVLVGLQEDEFEAVTAPDVSDEEEEQIVEPVKKKQRTKSKKMSKRKGLPLKIASPSRSRKGERTKDLQEEEETASTSAATVAPIRRGGSRKAKSPRKVGLTDEK